MILTEEDIKNLPLLAEDESMFYADGELEALLLDDFYKDVAEIDARYASRQPD